MNTYTFKLMLSNLTAATLIQMAADMLFSDEFDNHMEMFTSQAMRDMYSYIEDEGINNMGEDEWEMELNRECAKRERVLYHVY